MDSAEYINYMAFATCLAKCNGFVEGELEALSQDPREDKDADIENMRAAANQELLAAAERMAKCIMNYLYAMAEDIDAGVMHHAGEDDASVDEVPTTVVTAPSEREEIEFPQG